MTAIHCPDCGANLALVGRRHNCRPRVSNAPIERRSVSNIDDSVSNRKLSPLQRWRAANLDRYRSYMRDYMRKRQSMKKAAPSTSRAASYCVTLALY
jgi:hypothetical protein